MHPVLTFGLLALVRFLCAWDDVGEDVADIDGLAAFVFPGLLKVRVGGGIVGRCRLDEPSAILRLLCN